MPEPEAKQAKTFSWKALILDPFLDLWRSKGTSGLILLLAFMLLYKLGDNMATALSTPFYMDLGFSKTDIGTVVKAASLWSSIVGGIVGGIIMLRIGINKSLWIFGVVQLLTILGFAALSEVGPDKAGFWSGQRRVLWCGPWNGSLRRLCRSKHHKAYTAAACPPYEFCWTAAQFCECKHRRPHRGAGLYPLLFALHRTCDN